jgi:hypothetical protein
VGPVSLNVRYRPLRIGWCIEAESLEHFSSAVALNHVFWGGRFNPIIPCADRELAEALITAFRVDALYNISGTAAVDAFIKEFPHIQWPEFHPELFVDNISSRRPTLLDVGHPAQHLFESHVDRREKPAIDAVLYQWDATDPLRFALHATCGSYPEEAVTGRDYRGLFQKAFATEPAPIAVTEPLPADLFRKLTPNYLTTVELEATPLQFSNRLEPGFYYGNALDFTDLVNFWNLRACDIDLFFYDPNSAERLRPLVEAYSALLRDRPKRSNAPSGVNVWQRDRDYSRDLSIERSGATDRAGIFGAGLTISTFEPVIFNGLNLNPPVMAFGDKSVLGVSAEDGLGTSVTFQLPEKPFFSDIELHSQMMVVSVSAPNIGRAMLTPPFIPQLNEYYGRKAYFIYNKARAELGSLGIIQDVTSDQLTLRALPFTEVLPKIFETFGMKARPSPAGLVSARLIDQMGGLQGCRVFKIAGVRSLIKKYRPAESFERTEAVTMIGDNDPVTHIPRFDAYKPLYIEARDKKDLKPEDAFLYLLKKGVFRAGLKLACPTCQLDFWVPLDDAKSTTQCVYCGFEFNVLPQLRDRNWAYRRSGLFGREDNQRGGIPVAVTLQQLETMLHGRLRAYAPGIALTPDSAPIENCETDLVVLVSSFPHTAKPLELAIAECKDAGGEISEEDVRKLAKVAQALEESPCQVFILFSKCGRFTNEEVERCKGARRKLFEHQGKTHYAHNVIMLSERELEPYHIYEQTEKEFELKPHANSLEDLAINTVNIYFDPKPKAAAEAKSG